MILRKRWADVFAELIGYMDFYHRFDPVCLHGGGQWKRTGKEKSMSDPQVPMWQQWAQFRFGVVGELLTCPPSHGQLQEALDRLARQHYQHPIDPGRRICFGKSTIERWYYKARAADDPIAALGRSIRRDAGIRWSMSETLLTTLKAQYQAHRRWNVQLHYDNLKALMFTVSGIWTFTRRKSASWIVPENGIGRWHWPYSTITAGYAAICSSTSMSLTLSSRPVSPDAYHLASVGPGPSQNRAWSG